MLGFIQDNFPLCSNIKVLNKKLIEILKIMEVIRKKQTEDDQRSNLVWLDMEMSGLNPNTCRILEIAVIVTDKNLDPLDEGKEFVLKQADYFLDKMDDWNQTTHKKSGLIEKVKQSSFSENIVEETLIKYLETFVPAKVSPLCGNSIHQDRRFLRLYMPKLDAYFSYRNIDVSTVKELCKRWKPKTVKNFTKKGAHTAMADTVESIGELKFYRKNFFMDG